MLVWDHVIFSLQRRGGVSNWWLRHCNAMRPAVDCPIIDLGPYPDANAGAAGLAAPATTVMDGAPGHLWFLRRAPAIPGANVFHGSYYRVPGRGPRALVSFFDASMHRTRSPRAMMHQFMQERCLRRADLIHCISAHTANELQAFCPWVDPGRIRVVPLGIAPAPDAVALPGMDLGRPFVLFVGNRAGYKNGDLAYAASATLPEVDLLFAGGEPPSNAERATIARLGIAGRVRHLGGVSDACLRWLYERALALWYPSSNEGFGFPAIEAAAAGCPVLAASGHAVEEVVSGYGILTPEPSADWLAHQTRHLLLVERASFAIPGAQVAVRFTWPRYARAMAAVYRELGVPIDEAALSPS